MARKALHDIAVALVVFSLALFSGCGKKEKSEPEPKTFSEFAEGVTGRSGVAPAAPIQPSTEAGGEEKEEDRPLKIGVIGPETGEEADIGRSTFEGAELAADAFNRSGGINSKPVELLKVDNKGDSEATKEGVKSLVSEHVLAIIGSPTGWSTFAPVYIANESKTVFISAGTRRHIGTSGPFVFRVSLPVEKAADELMEYSVKEEGLREFFFITVMEDEALNVGSAFRRAAGRKGAVIKAEATIFNEDDLAEAVKSLKANMPADAVIFAGGPAMAISFLKQARKVGLKLPLVGGDELYGAEFLKGGELIKGSIIYSGFFTDDKDPVTSGFMDAYRRRYKRLPAQFSAEAYDSFMLLGEAIKDGGSTKPSAVKESLSRIKGFQGVTGTITIGPDREASRGAYLLKAVKKGSSVEFSMVKGSHRR